MSLFRKRLGRADEPPPRPDERPAWTPDEHPAWMHDGMAVALYEGRENLDVVGEASYQEALWRIVGKTSSADRVREDVTAVIAPEPDNPYDPSAVAVWVSGLRVGYLSRANAVRYRPGLLALQDHEGKPIALQGVIVGGGQYPDGPGRLGVFLTHDPTDFGVPSHFKPRGEMDTGFTDSRKTDSADDSYDLGWFNDVPEDPIRAIPMLRQLLETERDPINRHFMYHHLEAALYRSRETFSSALAEYDECCRQHDAEMETIRGACVTKYGVLPWRLHTYKQMCIRQAKAKDYEQALWWAERGLAVYGENAARPDAVDDLRKRAESYRAKLRRE
jgi:hypothetical protein